MKKVMFFLICAIFLVSFASAEIIINQQPNEIYNLGERINIPITLTTAEGIYDFLQVSLICNGQEKKLPKEEIDLPSNEVIKIEKSIFLIQKFINGLTGNCEIKAYLEASPENYVFSNEFKLSNSINVELETEQREFNPEEDILVEGKATRENGELVNGFLELVITENDSENKTYQEIVNNGFFSLTFSMPKDAKAQQYLVKLNIYEKDPLEEVTNNGFVDFNILINQIPTSLEVVFENQEVEPGTDLKVKALLHDQTGEKIQSNAIITIKNHDDKIFEQVEKTTNEFLGFPIEYNEAPSEWTVVAASNKMITESHFTVIEKEDVKTEIINKTVILTNVGNIPYNKTLLVKIGNKTINLDPYLEIDETKKYTLTAPEGEYLVEIIADGENKTTKNVALTGSVINIKEASGVMVLVKYPLAWIFIIFVLGFVVFMIFKKGYKKSFLGYITRKKENKIFPEKLLGKSSIVESKNKAELSLSLKGDKQGASIICLKLKNLDDIEKEESIKEILQKVTNFAEENKASIYENNDNLFFILSPATTKTFKNEKKAVEVAQKIGEILTERNRILKKKVDFGISLNYGDIIAKKDGELLKFMSFGNLITTAKKISSISDGEVYLSEKIKERLISDVKTGKRNIQGVDVYIVKEIKHKTKEHKKFIGEFIKRLEGNKDKKEEPKENKG
jgi:hypothetical protein|tara:strand:- start:11997 stop:14033 length:2037 start_codon:yes stop_codon:yes gene_type:complete